MTANAVTPDLQPLRLEGPAADHAEWDAGRPDDGFDAIALERAITAERTATYAELRGLDAA